MDSSARYDLEELVALAEEAVERLAQFASSDDGLLDDGLDDELQRPVVDGRGVEDVPVVAQFGGQDGDVADVPHCVRAGC